MSKTLLILAIFAFCLPLNVLSSDLKENENRELAGINLGDILKLLNGTYTIPTKNTTTPTTPVTNTTTPTTPNTTTPVTNTTTPTNPTTPVTNTTTPNATIPVNNTPSTNNTSPVPVTNNTSSNNTTTDPVANTTQPSNPTNSSSPDDSDSEPEPTTPTNSTSPNNSNNTTSPTNSTNTTTPAPVKLAKNDVNMTTFPSDCLRVHNQERMAVNLSNLTWSDSLAKSAQAWAENMAVNGFRHSGKTGENIASSTYSTKTLSRLLGLWVKEKGWFIVGCKYPSCSNSTAEVGHYTQMVWHSTTQVGCGFAPGVNRGYNYLCCQYYKAGNIVGQFVY